MSTADQPWVCLHQGKFKGRAATRQGATALVENPRMPGFATVENSVTGERWVRSNGSWFRGATRKKRAA